MCVGRGGFQNKHQVLTGGHYVLGGVAMHPELFDFSIDSIGTRKPTKNFQSIYGQV